MIGGGGAAREKELRHCHSGCKVKRLWREPRPDGIKRVEPRKQFAIKRGRSGECLKEMMMGVDEARQDHMGSGFEDHRVRDEGSASGRHKLSDPALPHHPPPCRSIGKNGQGILDPKGALFAQRLSFRLFKSARRADWPPAG